MHISRYALTFSTASLNRQSAELRDREIQQAANKASRRAGILKEIAEARRDGEDPSYVAYLEAKL